MVGFCLICISFCFRSNIVGAHVDLNWKGHPLVLSKCRSLVFQSFSFFLPHWRVRFFTSLQYLVLFNASGKNIFIAFPFTQSFWFHSPWLVCLLDIWVWMCCSKSQQQLKDAGNESGGGEVGGVATSQNWEFHISIDIAKPKRWRWNKYCTISWFSLWHILMINVNVHSACSVTCFQSLLRVLCKCETTIKQLFYLLYCIDNH